MVESLEWNRPTHDSQKQTQKEFYDVLCTADVSLVSWAFTLLIVIAVSGLNIYTAISMYRNRKRSPTKQRAPILGVYHALQYASLILIPFVLEVLQKAGRLDHWNQQNHVPWDRRLYKFIYTSLRIMVIWMIPVRYELSHPVSSSSGASGATKTTSSRAGNPCFKSSAARSTACWSLPLSTW